MKSGVAIPYYIIIGTHLPVQLSLLSIKNCTRAKIAIKGILSV